MSISFQEFSQDPGVSEESSDSDSDILGNVASSTQSGFATSSKSSGAMTNLSSIQPILSAINAKLDKGENVDLSLYPKIYIVTFRGIHFFKSFFSQEERRAARRVLKKEYAKGDHQNLYSPAVYKLAGLKLGEKIDTSDKKTKVQEAVTYLLNCTKGDISKAHQMYVNTYEQFRKTDPLRTTGGTNPFISTTRDPRHAALYALGYKATKEHACLRPTYIPCKVKDSIQEQNCSRKAKHPKVGYVEIILHTIASFHRNLPLITTVLAGQKKESINVRIKNECEFTFRVHIQRKHIVGAYITRFPSFPYGVIKNRLDYKTKYGIDTGVSVARYCKFVAGKSSKKTTLIDTLAEHFAKRLLNQALMIASNKGGIAAYLGDDGHLYATPQECTGKDTAKFSSLSQYQVPDGYDSGSESEEVVAPDVKTPAIEMAKSAVTSFAECTQSAATSASLSYNNAPPEIPQENTAVIENSASVTVVAKAESANLQPQPRPREVNLRAPTSGSSMFAVSSVANKNCNTGNDNDQDQAFQAVIQASLDVATNGYVP